MPAFLRNHLRALLLGPTQRVMLEQYLADDTAPGEIAALLRSMCGEPDERPLKPGFCCQVNADTCGQRHRYACPETVE